MKKQLETIANLMQELKAKFSKQKFETATLVDGTIVEWEGDLAVGTALFVVDGENKVPAPQGSHTTDGGVVVTVDENGIVTEIVEEENFEKVSTDEAPAFLEAMSEIIDAELGIGMDKAFDLAGKLLTKINEEQPQAEQMSADKVNEIVNAKMSEVLDTFSKGFESITSAFEAMTAEHKALKDDFEAFKKLPANKENEAQKFNRQGKDSNLTAKQLILLRNKNK
jgi:hypothetical protein